MALVGYAAAISATGDTTATTAEATTNLDPGTYKKYQITNAAKRIVDPAVTVTVKKNGVSVGSGWTLDYLFGTITFTNALLNTDVVTADFSYFPFAAIANCKDFSASFKVALADATIFGTAAAAKGLLPTLKEVTGTIGHLDPGTSIWSGASKSFFATFDTATGIVLDFNPGAGNRFRSWIYFPGFDLKAAVAGLVEGSMPWQSTYSPTAPAVATQPTFSWGT